MLESYLSPYLLSYVNKYIKNLRPEDLQVSLWGGDLVLVKLDLDLDVLEQELGNLPLTFLSGHIQELKIHVPWTALGSEPAVITINTIQFVVKLRDAASSSDSGRSESASTESNSRGEDGTSGKPSPIDPSMQSKSKSGSSDLTPGYIQSLTRRIINNAHVIVNNLILKYVEGDIVLSVNVKSLETFAVNEIWEKAFVDLALPELVLRRLCNLSDITVCLDRRNASGKIEVYQEPVIFHWDLVTRIHMTFGSENARFADVIKVSTFCRELHFSLTETQLPMYIRLVQLALALYYGTLDLPEETTASGEHSDEGTIQKEPSSALSPLSDADEQSQEGWAGWMWSLVPEVLSQEEEDEETAKSRKTKETIVSVGFYCQEGSFTFKLSEVTNTSGPFSTAKRLHVQPFLRASGQGMSLEVLMQGLSFFSTQVGLSHMAIQGLGSCTCGVDDYNITLDDERDLIPFVTCGSDDISGRETSYLTGSLFDTVCPENLGHRGRYILDREEHMEAFTEEYGASRFGAFWSDYLFTMTPLDDTDGSDSGGSNSSSPPLEPIFEWKEQSWKKFILYPCHVTISSSLVHRLQQLVFDARNHEYEPYSTEKPEIVDDTLPCPTREQVAALEEHIPSRSTQFSLLDIDVRFLLAEHPPFTAGPDTLCAMSDREPPASLSVSLLPSMYLRVNRLDLHMSVPMYARRLVRSVSRLPLPNEDLIYYCCSHIQFKVFGAEVGLSQVSVGDLAARDPPSEKQIMKPLSAAAYMKTLQLPMYWADPNQTRREIQLELPKVLLSFTKPDVLMASHLYHCWMSAGYQSDWLFESTLISDVFDKSTASGSPAIFASVTGINASFKETKQVWAVDGSVQKMNIGLQGTGAGGTVSIMDGPGNTNLSVDGSSMDVEGDLLSFIIQMKTGEVSDNPSVMFADVHGVAVRLDPALLSWFVYQPSQKSGLDFSHPPAHHVISKEPRGSTSSPQRLPGPGQGLASPSDTLSEDQTETSISKMKKRLHSLAKTLQEVVIQVNVRPAVFILPTKTVCPTESPSIIDVENCSSRQHLLVVRMPTLSVLSSGHHHVDLGHDIPLGRGSLPQAPGSKFPWAVKADAFEIFTTTDSTGTQSDLLEPLSIASTVAFNCGMDKETGAPSVGIVVHADMPGVQVNCSHEQIELFKELAGLLLDKLPNMNDSFKVQPRWLARPPTARPPRPTGGLGARSMTRSLTRSSRTSSDHPLDPIGTISSPMESVSQDESDEEMTPDPSTVRLSFWIQWTIDKAGACLITRVSPDTGKRVKLSVLSEDLSTSIDYQDIFSKVTCKVGALNIRHYEKSSERDWTPGCYSGILFTSSQLLTKSLASPSNMPRSPTLPRTRSLLRKSEHKFVDSKQGHGFFSFLWTRARSSSVSKRMEGGENKDNVRVKQKHFVNEVIVSMQPMDMVFWCPVIAETVKMFQSEDTQADAPQADADIIRIQPPTAARAKPVFQPVVQSQSMQSRRSRGESLGHQKAPTSTVSSFDKWFTSSRLPLVYLDVQETRCFLPVAEQGSAPIAGAADVFLFKVSHVKLVPFADNPLPRMVIKKEIFRRSQQGHSSQKPGSLMEDRQYQLDITSLGLFTAPWEEISQVTEEEKRSVDPEVVTSQNPALEWNTSPPKQDKSIVSISPVVEEFSVCCVAAPAITINRLNAERTASKPVIVCGHSVEGNISSDLCLYLSLGNITMAQSLLGNNVAALTKCYPAPVIRQTDPSPSPPRRTKLRHSRADSGFDSDMSHRSQEQHSDLISSLGEQSPSGARVFKQQFRIPGQSKTIPKSMVNPARKVIPFDVLFTGREISVFMFSKEDARVSPFLLTTLSQPSLAVSVSKRKQKVELSLYNVRVTGAWAFSAGSTGALPTVSDFPVPWLETGLGEPNSKTGVRPALLTLSFKDFLTGEGAISLDVGRPIKASLSIEKGEQLIGYADKIRSKFQKTRQVWPQPEEQIAAAAAQKNPFAEGLPITESGKTDPGPIESKQKDALNPLAMFRNVTLSTSSCVVAMATGIGDDSAHCMFSLSGSSGNVKLHPNAHGDYTDVALMLNVSGVSIETGAGCSSRPLIGPSTVTMDASSRLQNDTLSMTRTVSHVTCGHIPIFFGQDHLRTVSSFARSFREFLDTNSQGTPVSGIPRDTKANDPPAANSSAVHSKDDLRSGSFEYIIESDPGPLLPNQIQFQAGGPDIGHDGTMTWHYPEPRVLTRITMTPIPLRTATISSLNEEAIDVPCCLEYWDELSCCYQLYKSLFVSETNTYHLSLGVGQILLGGEGAVAASVWRMVLNPGRDSFEVQDETLSPMTIAASLRIDSCFSPAFIPPLSIALKCGAIDVHLENHLSQSEKVTPEYLQPFVFDEAEPSRQEFCTFSVSESSLSAQLWKDPSLIVKAKLNTVIEASLLNYSQLTMVPLIGNLPIEGALSVNQADARCQLEVSTGNVDIRIGQGTLHTLNSAAQSWINTCKPESESVVSAYYIICNNTDALLSFGQVDTYETIKLPAGKMHSYCWRTHKHSSQMLRVCIDDQDNPHWSDPFSIDIEGTVVARVLHQDQEAVLFVEISAITPLQKQIIFHPKQSFINHLTIPLEVQLQFIPSTPPASAADPGSNHLIEGAITLSENQSQSQDPGLEGETSPGDRDTHPRGASQLVYTVGAESSLPSMAVGDSNIVGFRVRVPGTESDWSEQFAIAGEMKRDKFVIEVPRSSQSSLFFCCAILEESHSGHIQRAILLSPCYWVNNYLPHPLIMNLTCRRNPGIQTKEVQGCGTMTPLYHLNPASPYLATFQLDDETSPSSPPIPISYNSDLFVVVPREPTRIKDLLFKPSRTAAEATWPYQEAKISQSEQSSPPPNSTSQPDTDLNIHLSQDWSHVDSVVINVEPWCLVANETKVDLTITDAGGVVSHIAGGVIMAPPKIQEKFSISVSHRGKEASSQPVILEEEKISPYMRSNQMGEKHLFLDSHVTVEIPFPVEGSETQEACYFVLQSEVKENIRLLKILPQLVIVNETEKPVAVAAVELGEELKKAPSNVRDLAGRSLVSPKDMLSSVFWRRLPSTDLPAHQWRQSISVSSIDAAETAGCQATDGRHWSKWVHVGTENTRQPFSLPIKESGPMQLTSEPWVAVMHSERGVTYLSLGVDPSPRMVLTNHCLYPLHVGQALHGRTSTGENRVLEDTQPLPEINIIPPQQKSYYSYQVSPGHSEPLKICLAVAPFFSAVQLPILDADHTNLDPDWSVAITVATDPTPASEIITLSTGSVVLVSSHVIGCRTIIEIEPLAMDAPTNESKEEKCSEKILQSLDGKELWKLQTKVSIKSVNLSSMDETQSLLAFVEVVSLHAHDLYFLSHSADCQGISDHVQRFDIAIRSLQVDNKAHASGRYDFPVIFKGKSLQKPSKDWDDTLGSEELPELLRTECFVTVSASAHLTENWSTVGWRDLHVQFNEPEVFIEDQFIFDFLQFCHSFPKMEALSSEPRASRSVLPQSVVCVLNGLRGPISLQSLTIEPITALASVHASMKVFVAVERTSLSFGQFHTGPVFATPSQLGQALSIHYSSGAIFKAGWVLGSLEILGNPAGLLRSVGSGLADSIILPYEGLIRGPTAFIAGVAGGLSSLVWQVTAGTLTSVTKFATSVSRNLDRLSLDSDHVLRQETARRKVPNRTTEGLTQGLSHFGISLLGAIAGIADQPIRGFQRAGSVSEPHAGSHAREVISGFGKGLVGAVVKPIGGAAELVSQTGQGILHGTGLAEVPKQLFPQVTEARSRFPNSALKLTWKLLPDQEVAGEDILMVLKVTRLTPDGLHQSSALVLTPETLFLVTSSEDCCQQALPLRLTQCLPWRDSENGLRVVVKGFTSPVLSPEVPETSDLIADFVDISSSFIGSVEELANSSMEQKPDMPVVTPDSTALTFHMTCRHHRITFLELFEKSKRKLEASVSPEDRI